MTIPALTLGAGGSTTAGVVVGATGMAGGSLLLFWSTTPNMALPPSMPNTGTNTAMVQPQPIIGNSALSPQIYSKSKHNKGVVDGLIGSAEEEMEKLRNDPTGFASPREHHIGEIEAMLDRARNVAQRLRGKNKTDRLDKIDALEKELGEYKH